MKRISRWFTAVALIGALGFEGGAVLAQTASVLYNFESGPPGPESLTMDSQGNLYGTLEFGVSAYDHGAVYKLSPPYGPTNMTVLYSFTGGADGTYPDSSLIMDRQGNLYGTTAYGGNTNITNDNGLPPGAGVVFKLSPPYGQNSETVLYAFSGGADGSVPNGLIMDGQGNLYGTTYSGGNLGEPPYTGVVHSAHGGEFDRTVGANSGVVFKLSPPYGQNSETVLYTFPRDSGIYRVEGNPLSANLLMDAQGNLYGTTTYGGAYGYGVVYRLSPPYGQSNETELYTFTGGPNGSGPNGSLVQDAQGNLYGTTTYGGASGGGEVFKLSPPYGQSNETVLYSFGSYPDGHTPYAGVILDARGNLYGTTFSGGVSGIFGTVYKLSPPYGQSNETILHSFEYTDGEYPMAGLIMDSQGNLYGTAGGGGYYGYGSVFEITP